MSEIRLKVWRWKTCRKVQKERRGGERHESGMRKTGYTDNPSEKKRGGRGEGVEMVIGVREVETCSVDRVCVSRTEVGNWFHN